MSIKRPSVGPSVPSRTQINLALDKAELARRSLKKLRLGEFLPLTLDEADVDPSAFNPHESLVPAEFDLHLRPYHIRPASTPGWVHANLNKMLVQHKDEEAGETACEKLRSFAVDDAKSITENLCRLPDQRRAPDTLVVDALNAKTEKFDAAREALNAVEAAWRGYHCVWLKDQAAIIVAETKPAGRETDPYSHTSLLKLLTDAEAKTWLAYQKRATRKTRSKGKRAPKVTEVSTITARWSSENPLLADLLREVIVENEPIGGAAYIRKLTIHECFLQLREGLTSLRKALSNTRFKKKTIAIGPSKLPQEIYRGAAHKSLSL